MTVYCAVPGCDSNSKTTDYTFHRLPRNEISRARWILALRRPVRSLGNCALVCGRHFEARMFSDRGPNSSGLVKNAVPTLFLPSKSQQQSTLLLVDQEKDTGLKSMTLLQSKAPGNHLHTKVRKVVTNRPNITKRPEGESRSELVACRVCLAASGRLYAISGSGLEDMLTALTGVELSLKEGFPRHLCAFCIVCLSKCAAFRDSCQRSTALLQALLEMGPLTIDDIKSVDRQANKLTCNLAQSKAYHFQTHPYMDIVPQMNIEDESQESPDFTEVEYLESDDGAENNENYLDIDYSINDVEIQDEDYSAHSDDEDYIPTKMDNESDTGTDISEEIQNTLNKAKRKRIELKKENTDNVNDYASDIDTDTSEEIIELRQRLADNKPSKVDKRFGTKVFSEESSIAAFEKEFDCKVRLLSIEEQKQEVEDRKMTNKSAFCCKLCGKKYINRSTLQTHMTYHDPSMPHECEVCRLRFRSRGALTKHRHCHRAVIACNQCGAVTRNRMYAKNHALMHRGNTYTCPYCNVVYNHHTSYYNHIRMLHPSQYEACDECGETFAAGIGLRLHKKMRHRRNENPESSHKCAKCDVVFLSAAALERHLEPRLGAAHALLFPCAACGESCGGEDARAQHMAEKHATDHHYCKECDKTFTNAAVFARHADRKHLSRRPLVSWSRRRRDGSAPPFVCEVCGKVLRNSTLLQYHMNTHLAVKPFQCPHCPKSFHYPTGLNTHVRVHTGERPFQCEKCPLAFANPANFNRHVKVVHGPRELVTCSMCGKRLVAASLAPHVRAVHCGVPYPRRKRTRRQRRLATTRRDDTTTRPDDRTTRRDDNEA